MTVRPRSTNGAWPRRSSATRRPVLKPLAEHLHKVCARLWVNSLNTREAAFDDQALVDPDAVWGAMTAAGVGAIQTDNPLPLKAWLATHRPKLQSCRR